MHQNRRGISCVTRNFRTGAQKHYFRIDFCTVIVSNRRIRPNFGSEDRKFEKVKSMKSRSEVFGYLSIGKMFGSNSWSFDCISCGTRRLEKRLLSFNLKCRVAFVCSINFSYSNFSMMCCGEKCMIKSNRF